MKITPILAATVTSLALVAKVGAQTDGLEAYPAVYAVQHENPWVRVVRVRLPGSARLGMHSHPAGFMFHVYLNDAEPILFSHDGPPYDITRPRVTARSFRVGTATPEVHAVVNPSTGGSDYLRIEYRTRGTEHSRDRISAPLLDAVTNARVEHVGEMSRVTRVTLAVGDSTVIATTASEPALLILVTNGLLAASPADGSPVVDIGQHRFVEPGRRVVLRNAGTASLQMLRFDFLTPPSASP